jgi:tetratricopeptide (TPR) repeat protein
MRTPSISLLFLSLVFCCPAVVAQSSKVDSLTHALATMKQDTNRVNTLTALADALWRTGEYDLADVRANELQQLSERLKFRKGEAQARIFLGITQFRRGDLIKADSIIKVAMAMRTESKNLDSLRASKCHNLLGLIHKQKGDMVRAASHFQHSLRICTMLKDSLGMATAYNNIGMIHDDHDRLLLALKNYRMSLAISKAMGNMDGVASASNNMALIYENLGRRKEAIALNKEVFAMHEKLGDVSGMAGIYLNLANIYDGMGDFGEALRHYRLSLKLSEQIGELDGMAKANANIAITLKGLGDLSGSMKHQLKALQLREKLGDKKGMASSLGSIAILLDRQGQYDEAEKMALRSLQLRTELGDRRGMSKSHLILGNIHDSRGDHKQALDAHKVSLQISEEIGYKEGVADGTTNVGIALAFLKRNKEAEKYFERAYSLRKELDDKKGMADASTNIAIMQMRNGAFSDAQLLLDTALALAFSIGSKDALRDAYKAYADLDSARGDHRAALHHHKLFLAYKDSILNEETSLQLSNLRIINDVEKKDGTIAQLDAEKKGALAANDAKERKQQATLVIGIILLILASGVFLLVMRNRRKRHQIALREAELQKADVEMQRDRAELEKSLAELKKERVENDYLRSQLTAHFTKNALSSIDGLIGSGQYVKAQEYTGRFHDLLKWTLQNASSAKVNLGEELEMMRHYLTLEAPCVEDGLRWDIAIADDVDVSDVELPPLILQPFVENALLHGIRGTGRMGEIRISVSREGAEVVCAVIDNGRGMASGDEAKRNSTGLRLVRERLDMFTNETQISTAMRMENTGSGTRAEVRLAA